MSPRPRRRSRALSRRRPIEPTSGRRRNAPAAPRSWRRCDAWRRGCRTRPPRIDSPRCTITPPRPRRSPPRSSATQKRGFGSIRCPSTARSHKTNWSSSQVQRSPPTASVARQPSRCSTTSSHERASRRITHGSSRSFRLRRPKRRRSSILSSAPRRSTAAAGSRAQGRCTPRIRRFAGSPTWQDSRPTPAARSSREGRSATSRRSLPPATPRPSETDHVRNGGRWLRHRRRTRPSRWPRG